MVAKVCAYCGAAGKLTKDHVWPDCFLTRRGRTAAHFSHQAGKVHGADYLVNDVCAKCNNTRLSPLDAYFCSLEDAYFSQLHDFDSRVVFRFEFMLLLRSLLKISYNSARSSGSEVSAFLPHRLFIAGLEGRQEGVALYLELVSPSLVSDSASKSGMRKIMPEMYRSAITQVVTPAGKQIVTRMIAVGSYYFHIALQPPDISEAVFSEGVSDLGRLVEGLVRLETGTEEVVLRSSPQDGLRSIAPHIQKHHAQYRNFFETNDKS